MPTVNEETQIEEIVRDPRKFGELYEMHYPVIFGYAFRRTMDYDAAKDIAAETFLKAYDGIGRFVWRSVPVLHWLYRIATNEINTYFRKRTYTPSVLRRIKEEYGLMLTETPNAEEERIRMEEELERRQQFVRINARLKQLPMRYQEVLALRFYEHRTIGEIAHILGKKEGTVKSLLSRGIDKLKEELNGGTP